MAPRYRIYPSLGVARLGNGRAEQRDVIFSPEVPWENLFRTDLDYLNEDGAIRKQAQRFYVYRCDDDGNPIERIGPDDYVIQWTVEVANKKPFWYDFNNSLDLSVVSQNRNLSSTFFEKKIAPGIAASYRNPNILGAQQTPEQATNHRAELVNNPAPVTVGEGMPKKRIVGHFPNPQASSGQGSRIAQGMKTTPKTVPLGTVEYDAGTLIFYAADGLSAALNPSDLNTDFADNSNWYDDICDGCITAKLTHRRTGEVTALDTAESAAWIATAPPDYAPQIQPISTLYDLICGAGETEYATDFSLVFPIFLRLYRMQWVNLGDLLSPSFRETVDQLVAEKRFAQLYDPSPSAKAVREAVFSLFRDPDYPYENEPIIPSSSKTSLGNRGGEQALKLPFYPGDGINYPGSPAQWFAIPPLLFEQLKRWKEGEFRPIQGRFNDMDGLAKHYQAQFAAAATDPRKAPLLMTRAVLETLYGGGFHPGVELTWPMRHGKMYQTNSQTFASVQGNDGLLGLREIRINAASAQRRAEIYYNDFGLQMTSQDVANSLSEQNPDHWLWQITPGDLTKWMGIPWQSDAGSCQAVFTDSEYPVPAWWAANLPVDVLTEENLVKIQDDSVLPATKRNIFANRLAWLKTTDTGFVGYHAEGGYLNGLINMVYRWKNIGMVAARPSRVNVDGIPAVVYVSSGSRDRKDRLSLLMGAAYPSQPAPPNPPSVFYRNTRANVWLPPGKPIVLCSKPDGAGETVVDDCVVIKVNGETLYTHDYSRGCSGVVVPEPPTDISQSFARVVGRYVTIEIEYSDKCGGRISASSFYLHFGS